MHKEYLWDIYNGFISKDTGIEKRFGYDKKYSGQVASGAEILAQYEAVYDDGSSDFFVCTATKILRWNSGGSSWDTLKTHGSSATSVSIAQYGDDVVFGDGVNATQVFTKGDSATSNLTMPSGVTTFKLLLVHNNRLWGVDPDNLPHYSALGNIEDWTTAGDAGAGYIDLLLYIPKGDQIYSMQVFSKAYICFFMSNHIVTYQIGTVASDFTLLQTTVNTGVRSEHGAISFGNDLYYLDQDTPKSMAASTTSQELDLNDFSRGVFGNYYRDLMASASGERICMTKFLRRSWLVIHIPIGTGGEILIWDYVYKIWSGRWRTSDKINAIMEDKDGNLVFASTGYVYKFNPDVFTDDGDTIEFYVLTPYYYGSNGLDYERIPYVEFISQTESTGVTLEVSVFFEYESSASTYEVVSLESAGSLWDEALWDEALWDASGEDIYRVRSNGRGKMHRLSFRNNQSAKHVKIKLWQMFPKSLSLN